MFGDSTILSTSISELNISNTFSIYPNPTKSILKVEGIELDKFEIYDSTRKQVMSYINSNFIDISNLSRGIYIAKLFEKDRIYHRKIMKQ